MATEMRKTGVEVVGDIPWGTHFCLFYETGADLLETVVSYCKTGLENQEFCLWVVAEPLTGEDAKHALKRAVPDLDQYLADQSIEIVAARDWYLQDGTFDLKRVIRGWNQKLASASARGYAGVRVTGDTAWLEKKDWKDFCEYEDSLNLAVANQRLAVLCTYPLAACGAAEILDVVRTHQFAVTRRRGSWDVIETAGHKQAKAEIKRLNEELEERVLERTSQLRAVNRELTKEALQRQRVEEALLRSEAYLAEAQRVSHTGSFGWSVPSGQIVWSDETFRILGYDPANNPTVEFILRRTHPDDRAFVQETLDQAARDRETFDFEHRLLMPDGSVKYVRVVGHPSTNSTNDESGDESSDFEFVGAVTDITESKRGEESLRRSEGYLAEAQRLTHTGSWVWRVARRDALHLSEEWYRVYGFDPDDGVPTWEERLQRIHPEDRAIWQATIDRAIDEKSDYEMEFRILLPAGTVRYIHTVGHPVVSASGELLEFVGSSSDVTERKLAEQAIERFRKLEAELAHMNRISVMGEMAASLAHEIKQPITAATTNAQICLWLLERETLDVSEMRDASSAVVQSVKRAADIIDRVRSLSKKSAQDRELVDVNQVVREIDAMLRNESRLSSVMTNLRLSASVLQVKGDRVQLQQVVMNLMLNAIEAMKDSGGELVVTSERTDGGQVLVSVSDCGVGLPKEKEEHIFDAFFTTKSQGTGMGLAISRSIIESHGGRLWAKSNPDHGATFRFELPQYQPEPS